MKIARFFSAVFGVLGMVLMVFSIVLCLMSLDREPQLKELPDGAVACAQALQQAVAKGDHAGISQILYGQPDFGEGREPADAAGKLIWEAFEDSLSLTYEGSCYATNSGIGCNAVVTALDISAVTQSISTRAHALMTARMAQAEDMDELYDETNNFRTELVEEILHQAVEEALDSEEVRSHKVTLTLVCEDARWWVVADEVFLQAISGGLA